MRCLSENRVSCFLRHLSLTCCARSLFATRTAAAAMGMKFINARVLKRYGYRKVLIVNTLIIGTIIGCYSFVHICRNCIKTRWLSWRQWCVQLSVLPHKIMGYDDRLVYLLAMHKEEIFNGFDHSKNANDNPLLSALRQEPVTDELFTYV